MTISELNSEASAPPTKLRPSLTMEDVAKALVEHRPKLVAVISKVEKNKDAIDDILSTTSVKALATGITQFEGACSFSTYLCNIAYNEAVTHVNKQVNRKTGVKIFYDHEIGTGSNVLESASLIEASSLELNGPEYPSAYKAWSLFRLEERSFVEIHQLTGESLSTVRRHVSRVSEQLDLLTERSHP
jgi:DNA-directed RNA polymerase specialized sigma24 family protein